jgi:putative transposase
LFYKLKLNQASVLAKMTNVRQDDLASLVTYFVSLHKLTCYLTDHFGGIVIEDLNVKGMLSNHKLSRAIADIGFRR